MRRHKPLRVWFAPWKTRCACGCGWFPCPDSITMDRPGPVWNARTAALPIVTPARPAFRDESPLMTPAQEWRSRGPAR